AAREVLGADRGTVFLYDRGSDELYVKVATGLKDARFPCTAGIAGQCAQSRRLINVRDCYGDRRFNQAIDRQTGYRTRCMLAAPLVGLEGELVGVMQVLNKRGGEFDEHDERIATALASQAAVALQRGQLMIERLEKQKLERDLQLAREIQQGVLPKTMPMPPGYDLAGWERPAEQTGGDIYDALTLHDGRVLLMMGDATGHGVGPAISVTQVRSMIRMAARLRAPLDDTFTHINDQLADDLASSRFVTAFIGVLDPSGHGLDYHSGGQGPLLIIRADGQVEQLPASTLPLGITPGLELVRPPPIVLGSGDIFALVSDGIFEAMNEGGEQFGVARAARVLHDHSAGPMADAAAALAGAVDRFAQGQVQADDMTIVLVRRR
ncbi:MAG TPA: GAF domain-containing SpoIIE family protein phosphatase, partial [Nonomuraea sp.]|nr:GAF domain-containing SpoIIE family protein phosphatase [Nonomuraea sp.]